MLVIIWVMGAASGAAFVGVLLAIGAVIRKLRD
jgi:hypothetical protein